jgi:hypothetical protein
MQIKKVFVGLKRKQQASNLKVLVDLKQKIQDKNICFDFFLDRIDLYNESSLLVSTVSLFN